MSAIPTNRNMTTSKPSSGQSVSSSSASQSFAKTFQRLRSTSSSTVQTSSNLTITTRTPVNTSTQISDLQNISSQLSGNVDGRSGIPRKRIARINKPSSGQSVPSNSASQSFTETTQRSKHTTSSATQSSSNPTVTTRTPAATSTQISDLQNMSSRLSGNVDGRSGIPRKRIARTNKPSSSQSVPSSSASQSFTKANQRSKSTTSRATQSSSNPTVTTRTPATTSAQISNLQNISSRLPVPAHAEPSTSRSTVPAYAEPSTSRSTVPAHAEPSTVPAYAEPSTSRSTGRNSSSRNRKKRKGKIKICPTVEKAISATSGILQSKDMCNFINQIRCSKRPLKVVHKFTRNIPALISQVSNIENMFYKRIRRNRKIKYEENRDIRYIKGLPDKLRELNGTAANVVLPERAPIVENSTKEGIFHGVRNNAGTIFYKEIFKIR